MLKTEEASLKLAYRGLVKAGLQSIRAAWKFGNTCWDMAESHPRNPNYTQRAMGEVVGLSASRIGDYMALRRIYSTEDAVVERAESTGHYDVTFLIGHSSPSRHKKTNGRHDEYDLVCAVDGSEVACVVCGGKEFDRRYRPHS